MHADLPLTILMLPAPAVAGHRLRYKIIFDIRFIEAALELLFLFGEFISLPQSIVSPDL
jgi:hypothetical protein